MTEMNEMLLKVVYPDGKPIMAPGNFRWSMPVKQEDGSYTPGEWTVPVQGDVIPCERGYHLCRIQDLPNWVRGDAEIYSAEADQTDLIVHEDGTRQSKIVVRSARLISKVETFNVDVLRMWAADCAEHALHFFEEKYPEDKRPREAISAARGYVKREITQEQLQEKRQGADAAAYAADAADAAYAAAYAADAAAAAADAAAYADAAYAADAAAAAADAAAYADAAYAADARQERLWQATRLAEILGLIPTQGV